MKGDGLGVLDSYQEIASGLRGIRTNLGNTDRVKGINDALNNVKDLELRLSKSIDDASTLREQTNDIIDVLKKEVLPLIKGKKKKGGRRRNT